MSDHTHIEWTDATWNPITGCSVVSSGCRHCYAMRLAGTRLRHHPSRAGLTREHSAGPIWTGEVRLNEQWLDQPLHWRTPRRIFVCAHGDLFHPAVPHEWIDRVFAVMALAPQHQFQCLTKRPERMRAWVREERSFDVVLQHWKNNRSGQNTWHLSNVWLGVSIENQTTADERIPLLLQTPAAVRFVSAEPLLGPIDLRQSTYGMGSDRPSPTMQARQLGNPTAGLDWVIAGGESGPGARPSHPDWFRSLREQCQAAGVAFFFKQWGEWAPVGPLYSDHDIDEHMAALDTYPDDDPRNYWITRGGAGWRPEFGQPPPGSWAMRRCGKRAAGRLLDGRTWSEYPAA